MPLTGSASLAAHSSRSTVVSGSSSEKSLLGSPQVARRCRREAQWVKPKLVVGVRHLRGPGALRHATVQTFQD
jgi:hypothetical protein